MDLYDSLFKASALLAPLIAFAIGAAGSLHCVGMCGGLALAVNRSNKDTWLYNIGRLLGYLSLALFFSMFGAFFDDPAIRQLFTLAGGAIVGAFLLSVGVMAIRGRELRFSLPYTEKIYSKLFRRFSKAERFRSFGIGASSILLPCALSNGFILAALSLSGFYQAALLVLCFWAGTLPAMILGPNWVRKLGRSAAPRAQKTMGVLFVGAGLFTLGAKVYHAFDVGILCLS